MPKKTEITRVEDDDYEDYITPIKGYIVMHVCEDTNSQSEMTLEDAKGESKEGVTPEDKQAKVLD
eukprot:15366426-Ditylum_brightwellii.AAC.1